MTVSDVIGATGDGRDLEDVLKARRAELDMMAGMDLRFSTSVAPTTIGTSASAIINSGTQAGTPSADAAAGAGDQAEQTQEAA